MALLQPVEHRLVDPVVAHQLPGKGDDVAFVLAERSGIALGAQDVDRRLGHLGAARGADLGGPDVIGVALAHRSEDRVRQEPRLDHRAAAVELDERQHPLGERRAVQQHAERPADLAEHAQNIVDDRMKFSRHVTFAGNRRYTRHVPLLPSVYRPA